MGEYDDPTSGGEALSAAAPTAPVAVGNAGADSGIIAPSSLRVEASAAERTPEPAAKPLDQTKPKRRGSASAVVLALIVAAIIGMSGWYLTRPTPLMIQGEVDSTRIDIAARVDGRLSKLLVQRGENVPAGRELLRIDNPELLAKLDEAKAGKVLAEAQLAHIHAGTRAETVAVRKAEIDRTAADVTLAQHTYDRLAKLTATQVSSQQHLDEATDALRVAERSNEQAKLAYQEAVAGYTAEEVRMAEAQVVQADAAIKTLQSLVDQMVVVAPTETQVYQINVEEGEVVAPGIPLMSLVDMNDVWLRFDLREDLVKTLKLGDRITVRIPALGDRQVVAEVRLIAAKGEYTGWRATRATGDFDLRTFAIRAYPVEKIAGLRPGMSAYADWPAAVK